MVPARQARQPLHCLAEPEKPGAPHNVGHDATQHSPPGTGPGEHNLPSQDTAHPKTIPHTGQMARPPPAQPASPCRGLVTNI